MIHKFFGGRVILGNTFAPDGVAVYTKGEKIIAVTCDELPFDVAHDAKGKYISPGFIDIHVHGGGGKEFIDGDEESFLFIAELHAKHGTTTLLPTASTATTDEYVAMFETFGKVGRKNEKGAYMPGIHMESPYFSRAQTGAQGSLIRDFDKEEYTMLIDRYGELINRWSAAPELPGADEFASACREAGIKMSIGHSDAEYDRVMEAYDLGFECVTHLYSCTSTVHRKNAYRYAGIVEAAYMIDGMDVEIIADGKHLPSSLLKFVVKHKGLDRVAVITDATRCAGLPDGAEKMFENPNFIIEDGVAKLPDRSAFSGSVCTTNRLVRNMINLAELPLLDAVRLATVNPARMAGLSGRGVIRKGAYADIVVFDDNIDISLTMVNGNVVFEK
ncbi:MAG: N-acetylglucosamine-6-phosphate deacetylase [Oscillospiraceae bacterium]|nr:N-acetylglucosamine-6-phosphate deacetylase [Oscillospiraceae bacterium]